MKSSLVYILLKKCVRVCLSINSSVSISRAESLHCVILLQSVSGSVVMSIEHHT